MKEYRLAAWPQLRPPFDKIAYRRMLSDMSHRYMTLAQLVGDSGWQALMPFRLGYPTVTPLASPRRWAEEVIVA